MQKAQRLVARIAQVVIDCLAMRGIFRFATMALVLGSLVLSSSCTRVAGLFDSSGTRFVVEILPEPGGGPIDAERVIGAIETRLAATGSSGSVKRVESEANKYEVVVHRNQNVDVLQRFLFATHKVELRPVVSPPSPSPAETFRTREEAEKKLQSGNTVLPYSERDGESGTFVIVGPPFVTGEDIREASAVSRTGNDFDHHIRFILNPDGASRMEAWTGKNINNYLAVVLNDKVISIAYIRSQITDAGEISGNFSKEHAEEIASSLGSGYLPVSIKVISSNTFE